MAESTGTDELRKSAQDWNLEGDRKLLSLLQNIHQNITLRCTNTSKRLNEMFLSLDHAKVSMDNVNNRFMSLSNTQFVESRVYEDDPGFVTPQPTVKKSKQEETHIKSTPQQRIAAALTSIENNHERVTILDDSDSDTDDEGASVILRPRNVYDHRPLPFIIGSQSWKSKWHAGLIVEDSDTESIASKKDEALSDSDDSIAISAPNTHADAKSFRSVSPESLPVQEDLYKPDMSKVYRSFAAPHTAPQAYLFVDEPPPIDNDTDATSIRTESDSDDIFAELHKKDVNKTVQNSQDLSKNPSDIKEIDVYNDNRDFNTPDDNKQTNSDVYHGENDNFDKESDNYEVINSDEDFNQSNIENVGSSKIKTATNVSGQGIEDKKPTGAVSLFGTNNAAKSIGAAILKRNQRKSTSSEDDDEKTNNQAKTTEFNQHVNQKSNANKGQKDSILNKNTTKIESERNIYSKNPDQNVIEQIVNKKNKGDKQIIVTEKNIFDELFAKSKENSSKSKKETKNIKKVDLFSDIFDDIDDIFTSNVKIDRNSSKNIKKSVFDDIFSDETGSNVEEKHTLTKSIFNDDSDLFNEPVKQSESKSKEKSQKNMSNNKLLADVESNKNIDNAVKKTADSTNKTMLFNSNDDSDLFKNNAQKSKSIEQSLKNSHTESKKLVKSIFDSDSDDGDIFSAITAPAVKKAEISNNINTDILSEIRNVVDNSSNLSTDELPLDISSDIVPVMTKNTNDKMKNIQVNDYSEEKTMSEEVSKELCTESKKLTTNTDRNTLQMTKEKNSQNNNNPDQNSVKEDNMKFDTTRTGGGSTIDKQDSNSAPTNIQSESDLHTSKTTKIDVNTNKGQLFPNDSTCIGDSQNTAINQVQKDIPYDSIEREFVINQNKDGTQNENHTSYMPKTINIQSNTTKTSELKISETEIKVDNVKDLQRDTFEDIFPEEPPEFEKAKESKSNQNVNALFGDDSEDENLFFKKETLISDEKPDNAQVQTIDPLFGVFREEPPDFDDDFLFKTPTQSTEAIQIPENANNKEALFSDSPKTNIPESKDKITLKETDKESIDDLDHIKERDRSTLFDLKSGREETDGNTVESNKTIGKLKPINFNINVANLLPGASPKKLIKPAEPSQLPSDVTLTDGGVYTKLAAAETVDKIIKHNNVDVQNMEAKVAEPVQFKSVSFDSDPESSVLDTKISKQRARIQVKRRPSTRQARKDAARKSVIEFNENIDTVDSNFKNDESISTDTVDSNLKNDESISTDTADDQALTSPLIDKDQSIQSAEINIDNVSKHDDIFLNHESTKKRSTVDKTINPNNSSFEIINPENDIVTDVNLKHETTVEKAETSKIFNEIVKTSPENILENYKEHAPSCSKNDSLQVLSINDEDIYIFREPKVSKDDLVETKITTLGQVYHEDTAKDVSKTKKEEQFDKKKSIFDDDDDDDELLFSVGNTTLPKATKPAVKTSIFEESNSLISEKSKNLHNTESTIDDEQDLFSTGNTKKQILPKTTKSQVKASIFDEEDEQLFSSGNTKTLKNKQFLFDDISDDDDNLFGGKPATSNNLGSTDSQSGLFTSKLNKMESKSLTSTLFDDDEDDLFGPSSSKSAKDTNSQPFNAEVTKDTKDSNEKFSDPLLSMFKNYI